jgi:hypothetical protein
MYNNISAEKCFSNSNDSNKSSSDYIKTTKQKTIYTDIANQIQNNFIKSNGVNYNKNFGLHNNCLAFAKSYDLLLDVTKGKYYSQPIIDPDWVSNESWSSVLYSVNYSANGVNAVVDTSYNAGNANQIVFPMTQSAELADISWNGLYPGVRIDPSYNIFYNECENQNYWRDKLVDMSFNNTNYSIQSKQQSEQLYGMVYPGNVSFNCGDFTMGTVNDGKFQFCLSLKMEEMYLLTGAFTKSTNLGISTYTTIAGFEIGTLVRLIIPNNNILVIPINQNLYMKNYGSIFIQPGGTLTVNGHL